MSEILRLGGVKLALLVLAEGKANLLEVSAHLTAQMVSLRSVRLNGATRCGHEDYLAQGRASGVAALLLARNLSGVGAVLGSVHAHHRNGDADLSQLEIVHAPHRNGDAAQNQLETVHARHRNGDAAQNQLETDHARHRNGDAVPNQLETVHALHRSDYADQC